MGGSDTDLVLWGASTTRTMRPHWALREVGADYETRMVAPRSGRLQTEEMREVSPREKVPVLQDGDFFIAESAAIVNYVGDRHGAGSGLTPASGTRERGLYDQWCFYCMMELDAHTLYIVRKHDDLRAVYGEAPQAIVAAREGFRKQIRGAALKLGSAGPYLLGESFTGADILLETCLSWADGIGIELDPVFTPYLERVRERPAYRAAFALNYSILPDGTPRAPLRTDGPS